MWGNNRETPSPEKREEAKKAERDVRPVHVVATANGWYNRERKKSGDKFTVKAYEFSENWMKRI